jgi:hypothetical protein
MATCAQVIANIIAQNKVDEVDVIYPNTRTHFAIGPGQKHIFIFHVERQDTVRFITELVPIGTPGQIKMTISIFSYDESSGTIIDLGSVLIEELYQEFQKDLSSGTYFMCITNFFSSFDAYITGAFVGFVPWVKLTPKFYEGTSCIVQKITQPGRKKDCDRPIHFEIIEGSLPPGISMTGYGKLYGILPNLDCVEENADLSPSANWFGQHPTGVWFPWGRQWRFKVRITIPEFPTAIDEKWFCIRVYNNWDLERDNFEKNLPFSHFYEIVVEDDDKVVLKDQCQPCAEKTTELPPYSPLPELCSECSESVKTDIQMFKIPKKMKITIENLIAWYRKALNLDPDDICEEEKIFLTNLINSNIFKNLLIKKGILEADIEKLKQLEKVNITVKEIQGYIQLLQSTLIDGRNKDDIDYEYLNLVKEVNQTLPMEFVAFAGEYFG